MVDYSMLANLGLPHEAKQRTLNRRLLFMLFLSVCGLQQVYQRELLPLGSKTKVSAIVPCSSSLSAELTSYC